MKRALESELTNPTNLVYPTCTGQAFSFFNIEQPSNIWYCGNPFSKTPRLDRLSLSDFNGIVSKQRGLTFSFQEGIFLPETLSVDQRDEHFDFTEVMDKLYIGNLGRFGNALFTRTPLRAGTKLGFLGGNIITQDFKNQCDLHQNYACLSYASSIVKDSPHRPETYTFTAESCGGILGFAQSAPTQKVNDFPHEHIIENMNINYTQVGNYVIPEGSLAFDVDAGSMLVWDYGENFWALQKQLKENLEELFSPFGEDLGTTHKAKEISQSNIRKHITEGNKFSYKAYSYFQNEQYQLAIRYWKEAYKHQKKWLEENTERLSFNGTDLYKHTLSASFHRNLAKAYNKLGESKKTIYHKSASGYITNQLTLANSNINTLSENKVNVDKNENQVIKHN